MVPIEQAMTRIMQYAMKRGQVESVTLTADFVQRMTSKADITVNMKEGPALEIKDVEFPTLVAKGLQQLLSKDIKINREIVRG